ncbi:hypothetical protein SAY86_009036 [Trapa natans]|uniref:Fe2OG dioxygenase domain-containing protein n=1 Tax=Trapa natans TaxID=22666 RepID=A0AAN7KF43_TRANT|nr:hypothetical protein SAY86_009036 [Trapa natans]
MSIEESSYPPQFRHHSLHLQDAQLQPSSSSSLGPDIAVGTDDSVTDPIPIIDLQLIDRERLQEACRSWGLFRLVNHGVPLTILTEIQELAARLFSLPFDTKKELLGSPLSYFWGTPVLTPSGAALGLGVGVGPGKINWVEGLNAPLGKLPQLKTEDPLLSSLRSCLQQYGAHLGRLATSLFHVMSQDLNLQPKAQSGCYISESTGFVRVYRYPHCPPEISNLGMDTHTDSSLLTILCQDDVGGLEVIRGGEWIPVRPTPGTLVINLGDMMQAISDDEYKSAIHRVKINEHKDRISIGYFVFPAEDAVIQGSKYSPFKYSEFQEQVQKDVKTLGFKVGLERFKIIQ